MADIVVVTILTSRACQLAIRTAANGPTTTGGPAGVGSMTVGRVYEAR
jgi:hypothetical protein